MSHPGVTLDNPSLPLYFNDVPNFMQTHHNQPKNFLAEAIQNEIQQLGLDLPDKVIPELAAYAKSYGPGMIV